jgi:hypothetical protein
MTGDWQVGKYFRPVPITDGIIHLRGATVSILDATVRRGDKACG